MNAIAWNWHEWRRLRRESQEDARNERRNAAVDRDEDLEILHDVEWPVVPGADLRGLRAALLFSAVLWLAFFAIIGIIPW